MPKLRWPPRPERDAGALRHLILSDRLSVERTYLATERTLLSYVRTALALVAGGVTLLHFFDTRAYVAAGFFLLTLGGIVLVFGVLRFYRIHRRVSASYRRTVRDAREEQREEMEG